MMMIEVKMTTVVLMIIVIIAVMIIDEKNIMKAMMNLAVLGQMFTLIRAEEKLPIEQLDGNDSKYKLDCGKSF